MRSGDRRLAADDDDEDAHDDDGDDRDEPLAVDEAGLKSLDYVPRLRKERAISMGNVRELNQQSVHRSLAVRYTLVGLAAIAFIVIVVVLVVALPLDADGSAGDGPGALTSSNSLTGTTTTTTWAPPQIVGGGKFLHFSDFHLDLLYDSNYGDSCFCNDPRVTAGANTTRVRANNNNISSTTTTGADSPSAALDLLAAECRLADDAREAVLGRHRCDSPELLVNRTLQRARAVLPTDPAFILVTGDYVRHNTDELFARLGNSTARLALIVRTLERVDELIKAFFPSVITHHAVEPFYEEDTTTPRGSGNFTTAPSLAGAGAGAGEAAAAAAGEENDGEGMVLVNVLGNNDLDGDYSLPVPSDETVSPWLALVAPAFFGSLETAQSRSFRAGGCVRACVRVVAGRASCVCMARESAGCCYVGLSA